MSTDTNQTADSPGAHGPGGLTRAEPDKPSAGRIYDYILGGRTWFDIDRRTAEQIVAAIPEAHDIVHLNRTFLQRAVRTLAELGVEQFVDVGAGLPTMYNTDETAQAIRPDARILYVDHDPVVVEDSIEILRGRDAQNVAYIAGEFREPASILDHPEAQRLIDFDRPVAYLHIALWHFIPDDEDPIRLRDQYLERCAGGAYLAISTASREHPDPNVIERLRALHAPTGERLAFRSTAEVMRLFEGLELLPPYDGARPGLAAAGKWGSTHPDEVDSAGDWLLCGVARKP